MLNPLDLTGRSYLVTGASSGIGRATCVLLSELGARVALLARDETRLAETLAAMQPGAHHREVCDLADTAALPARLAALAQTFGPLDGLVHCAGILATVPLRAREPEDIALTLDAMMRDLLSTNELDAFLKTNGWQLLSQNVALASQAEDVRFDVPFGVITEQSGRNAPTVLH